MTPLRLLGRAGVVLFATIGALMIFFHTAIVIDILGAPVARDVANLQIPAPGLRAAGRPLGTAGLQGYLARPVSVSHPGPAVLLVHEWWGLNQDMVQLADALAAEGYTALAIDTWRGRATTSVVRAIWFVVTANQERINADFDAYLDYLRALEGVDPERVAGVGFCFGGGQIMLQSLRDAPLAAKAIFYGDIVTDPQRLQPLIYGGPVLGIFGAQDRSIPPRRVQEFETVLQGLNVPHEITVYPGVGHAFVKPATALAPGATGPAAQAWGQLLDFLRRSA